MDKVEAIQLIRESVFSKEADWLIDQLRPSARLVVQDESAITPNGSLASRFGGIPYLPHGVEWPVWDRRISFEKQIARLEKRSKARPQSTKFSDRIARLRAKMSQALLPLSFLGQLNLAEIHSIVQLPGWSHEGTLAFFFEPTLDVWGFDPDIRGYFKVLYFSADQKLYPATAPKDHPDFAEFPERKLSIRCEWTLPSYLRMGEVDLSSNDDYERLLVQLMQPAESQEVIHRAGGYPQEVQNAMELECQLVTNGLYCGDTSGYQDPRRAVLEKGAEDWRLLLQIDSDEAMKWMWGDAGRLYFWARQQDIETTDFDAAWALLQCH